jgi:hypothetical protein
MSIQFLAHDFRQVINWPQVAQSLLGRKALLPLKVAFRSLSKPKRGSNAFFANEPLVFTPISGLLRQIYATEIQSWVFLIKRRSPRGWIWRMTRWLLP